MCKILCLIILQLLPVSGLKLIGTDTFVVHHATMKIDELLTGYIKDYDVIYTKLRKKLDAASKNTVTEGTLFECAAVVLGQLNEENVKKLNVSLQADIYGLTLTLKDAKKPTNLDDLWGKLKQDVFINELSQGEDNFIIDINKIDPKCGVNSQLVYEKIFKMVNSADLMSDILIDEAFTKSLVGALVRTKNLFKKQFDDLSYTFSKQKEYKKILLNMFIIRYPERKCDPLFKVFQLTLKFWVVFKKLKGSSIDTSGQLTGKFIFSEFQMNDIINKLGKDYLQKMANKGKDLFTLVDNQNKGIFTLANGGDSFFPLGPGVFPKGGK